MTSLRVLVFARYAELLGAGSVEVALGEQATVRDVISALRALPGGAVLPPDPLVAVNLAQAAPDHPVRATDEVALLPPLAGG
jgi:molybdopterin converting factor small subunit